MQVLGASTTEERGGCDRRNTAKRREKNGRIECRRFQQNTWNRGRTVRLFEDEQHLEGSNVTCWNPEETLLWKRWRPLPRK
jgi:hypothetical protein